MYASYIGKKFLRLYNERNGLNYTAREFFDKEMHPLFYADDRLLQWVINSPFVKRLGKDDQASGNPVQVKLDKFHRKVQNEPPDASFVIGFPARGVMESTSGQVSNLSAKVSDEEIYASWIGGAMGIGVSGGLVMLIDEDEVLWMLYKGWKRYRNFLNQTPNLKGNQIDTWNGRWIEFVLQPENETGSHFQPEFSTKDGVGSIETQDWVRVLFALAQQYPDKLVNAYVYSLSQMNKTIGFIQLHLPQVNSFTQLLRKYFAFTEAIPNEKALLRMYETYYSFNSACRQGSIGLREIEPAKLREFMPGEKTKNITLKDSNTQTQFELYKLWIMAMLDNQDLYRLADELAKVLFAYEQKSIRGTKKNTQAVENLWKAGNRKLFIESLTDIMKTDEDTVNTFEQVVHSLMKLPADSFPLFATLARFQYTAHKVRNRQHEPEINTEIALN